VYKLGDEESYPRIFCHALKKVFCACSVAVYACFVSVYACSVTWMAVKSIYNKGL